MGSLYSSTLLTTQSTISFEYKPTFLALPSCMELLNAQKIRFIYDLYFVFIIEGDAEDKIEISP